MIKVISFDIGGTLIYRSIKRENSLKQILMDKLGTPEHLFNVAYTDHFIKRKNTVFEFYKLVCCQNTAEIEKIIANYYNNKPLESVYEDVLPVLTHFKKLGYYIIAISNKSYRNFLDLSYYGLHSYFDAEIYSHNIGYSKPDINIYRYAQKKMNVKSSEVVHVGNSIYSDIYGANNANWSSVLINRDLKDEYKSNIISRPDYVIQRLDELIPIVSEI